ncbi:MAG TPA: DNA gyrase inhibitor YacG [Terriglobales bacterium]|nr:DNA gyrase inhibitor YacG [Terriglobales bacterium]
MARKHTLRLRCPTCKKAVKNTDPEFPFCSERCRLIDLGKWASGAYVISSPLQDTSDISSEAAPEDDKEER